MAIVSRLIRENKGVKTKVSGTVFRFPVPIACENDSVLSKTVPDTFSRPGRFQAFPVLAKGGGIGYPVLCGDR